MDPAGTGHPGGLLDAYSRMRIEHDVIDRSAEEGARVVALALLASANDEADRLAGDSDEEALHDFRVALRRLRTALRAFRPWLDEDVKPRLEKRLERCARATNRARDAEVHLAWLSGKSDLLTRRQRRGVEYLRERLQDEARDAPSAARVVERYRRASTRLGKRLGTYQRRVDAGGDGVPSFGGVLASLVSEQLDAMRTRIEAVGGSLDVETIHEARIEAKRLRYLLEPLCGNRHADTRDAVSSLKRLQDVLGELHDTHVLGRHVRRALIAAAQVRARELYRAVYERGATGAALRDTVREGPRAGLIAVARMVRERREALFADLDREWRNGALELLATEIHAVAAALEARAGGKIERERKYLLTGVPPRALDSEAAEIQQGWLPGARLRERIRRIADSAGERYWRGLKQGAGRARLEAEEETAREVFETLWPLTEGRRIAKRRRRVKDDGLVWEIDEFLDRDLVLAEVELPAGRASDVALPDWLRPLVVREVTDDPAYLNENLAVARAEPPAPAPAPAGAAEPVTETAASSGEAPQGSAAP